MGGGDPSIASNRDSLRRQQEDHWISSRRTSRSARNRRPIPGANQSVVHDLHEAAACVPEYCTVYSSKRVERRARVP